MATTSDSIPSLNTTLLNSTLIPNGTKMAATKHVYSAGDVTWVLCSTFLVFLMTPGLGFFYSGMSKSKSALHILILCFVSMVVVSIQWFCFGYSLTFSSSNSVLSKVIGNFDNAFMMGMADEPSALNPEIPALVFYVFQNMFAAITPALAIGAAAERGRFLPTIVFMAIWTTLVYDVLAYWSWNPNGWVAEMGGLDFAGGTPIHIASGAAALAYAVILGPREDHKEETAPHNMTNVILGTAMIWFGWFGFNGGSALAANSRAIMACIVTHLAACVGGITWVFIDYRLERKYSPMGFCAGAIAGLVCITPASGFVSPASSLAFGFFGAVSCNIALSMKKYYKYDDALDVFAVHGVGGIIGNILTGIFAQKWIAALDGVTEIKGGWLDGHWEQMGYQLADTASGMAWSFVITYIILFIMNKIPGLSLRVKAEKERAGLDQAELGISAYEHIVEMLKHVSSSRISLRGTPSKRTSEINGNTVQSTNE